MTRSGAAGAIVMGTVTTAMGGYWRAGLLVAFFLSSSGLSRLPGTTKHNASGDGLAARSEQRDIIQVIANGGVATALGIAGGVDRLVLPYLGAVAAVTGDTWATEIGSRSPSPPRHLLTRSPVPPGTSGGVTLPGTAASIAGGTLIGLVAALGLARLTRDQQPAKRIIVTGAVAGTIGSLADSLLGATLQERRWCAHCELPTEQPVHRCGSPALVVGGVRGLNNDVVNVACSLTGALAGYVVKRLAGR